MAGTYGAAGTNLYKIPKVNGFFSNEVNATTGVTQVYIQGPFLTQKGIELQQSVGTYNPKTKKFTPDANSSLTQQQISQISSSDGLKSIKNASQKTAAKGIKAANPNLSAQDAQKQSNQLVDTNTASTTEDVADQATSADVEQGVEFSNQLINNQAIKDGDGIRKEYGQNLIYPITFPENQDRIKFSMFRYSPRRLEVNENLGATSKNRVGEKTIFGNVILPISPSISDQNTVSWGDDTLNAIEALAAATAYRGISEGPKGIAKSIENIARGSTDPALKTAAAAYFAAAAAGGNKNFLSRVTGGVLNPNLELLFNGPQLRTFSFSFTLSAREPNESKRIREIIRFFKQGMSVKRATSNLFVKAPNIFDISYHLGSGAESDHPWINKIKTCALTNCSVNYTPAGNYATFYDGAMTAYELTLSFSELDPIFEDNYKDLGNRDRNTVNKDTMIGY